MSKSNKKIERITKRNAKEVLDRYHYLSKLSRDFKSGYN